MMRLTVGSRALVVIAGLPGSGKSTLLHHLECDVPLVVLDSDQVRRRLRALLPEATPYARFRPAVHVLHRSRVVWRVLTTPDVVVVHDPATGAATRAWLAVLGALGGRSRHLVWVEASPDEALAGQRHRGRVVRTPSFARHVRRLPRVHAALRGGPRGWHTVTVVDRSGVVADLRLQRLREPDVDRASGAR